MFPTPANVTPCASRPQRPSPDETAVNDALPFASSVNPVATGLLRPLEVEIGPLERLYPAKTFSEKSAR